MSALSKPIEAETAFNSYVLDAVLGEGGAGRVYAGTDSDGAPVAVKVLTATGSDKRKRFKNEIAFLSRQRHVNVVPVLDSGVLLDGKARSPFYVMPRFAGSLRGLMKQGPAPTQALERFAQVLDGVEAAHLLGAVHRDLKPENVLVDEKGSLAVADFGVASFTSDHLVTHVQTGPEQRLANFLYAAPEQRVKGRQVGIAADIYALGLILNELFTGEVPHGTAYRHIADIAPDYAFLDPLVERMLAQDPGARPQTIADVKVAIIKYRSDAVALQKLDQLKRIVIQEGEVEDPLAHEPPRLIDAEWTGSRLNLKLDRVVSHGWVECLKHRLGNYSAVLGRGPEAFTFQGDVATIGAQEHEAQGIIDHFKNWLPQATRVYHHEATQRLAQEMRAREQDLKRQRETEEARLRVNRSLRV